MFTINKVNAVADNTIMINGTQFMVTDSIAEQIYKLCIGQTVQNPVQNTPAPTKQDKPLHLPAEKKEKKPLPEGKKLWQENFVTVLQVAADNSIRVYMDCPIGGDKGKFVREKIKSEFKSFGAKWSGDLEKNEVHWTFGSEDEAKKYIAARKKATKERA